jgi:hypothetical protein
MQFALDDAKARLAVNFIRLLPGPTPTQPRPSGWAGLGGSGCRFGGTTAP